MRRPATIALWAMSILLAVSWMLDPAQAQQTHSAGNWNWVSVTQAECEQRARRALAAAASRFSLPFQVRSQDGWIFGDTVGHTSAYIACVADDDTPNLVSAAARRVLVVVDVDTVRAGVSGQLRDFLRQCFRDDSCGGASAAGPVTAPGAPAADPQAGAFLGCYADKVQDRDLPDLTKLGGRNSAQSCIAHCGGKGFAFAGTQYGVECACGNSYGKHGQSGAVCDYDCGGRPGEKCGGFAANSIYATGVSPAATRQLPPDTPFRQLDAPRGAYLGCYADKVQDRDLPDLTKLGGRNSAQSCIAHCGGKGFAFAGTQYGVECACGNSYGKHGTSGAVCDYDCGGRPGEKCGGFAANSIYATGVTAVATRQPSPSPTPSPGNSGAAAGAFLGCYADKGGDRDLPDFTQLESTNSPQACTKHCADKGYIYAGTQYGRECACGDTYGKHGPSKACDYACTGAPGEICGGYYANSIYATGVSPAAVQQLPPDTPFRQLDAPRGTYLGCFVDKRGDRDLRDFTKLGNANSGQACVRHCAGKGFAFAGTQYGVECACGNSYGKHGTSPSCDYDCGGKPGEKCGGHYANSVYSTGIKPRN